MKVWSSLVVLGVAVLIAAGSAFAEGPKKDGKKKGERPPLKEVLQKLDTDEPKGELSVDELSKARWFAREPDKAKERAAETIKKATGDDKATSVKLDVLETYMKKMWEGKKKDGGKKRDRKEKENKT
jgi:hypothetical protein